MKFKVIGAGLAGVEAAWQIANNGYNVSLYEMKPIKKSEAHKSDLFCERGNGSFRLAYGTDCKAVECSGRRRFGS